MHGFELLKSQDDEWLRPQRVSVGRFWKNRTIDAGETGTRATSGAPLRWAAGWVERLGDVVWEDFGGARGWDNAARSKTFTRAKAQFLRNLVFVGSSGLTALYDV